MPVFHFNFREGTMLSVDDVGLPFKDIESAYLEAFEAVQDLWSAKLRERCDPRNCAFEITDSAGTLLITLQFQEVLEACHRSRREDRPPPNAHDLLSNAERMKRLSVELLAQLAEVRGALVKTQATLARVGERDAT